MYEVSHDGTGSYLTPAIYQTIIIENLCLRRETLIEFYTDPRLLHLSRILAPSFPNHVSSYLSAYRITPWQSSLSVEVFVLYPPPPIFPISSFTSVFCAPDPLHFWCMMDAISSEDGSRHAMMLRGHLRPSRSAVQQVDDGGGDLVVGEQGVSAHYPNRL